MGVSVCMYTVKVKIILTLIKIVRKTLFKTTVTDAKIVAIESRDQLNFNTRTTRALQPGIQVEEIG